MKDMATDQEDYAGRVEQEMARRLGLIGASSDSALLRSRFGEYSQLPIPSQLTVTYRRRRRRRAVKLIASVVFRGLLVSVILAIAVRTEMRKESWGLICASVGVLFLNEVVRSRSGPKYSSRADSGRRVVLVGSGERAAEFMGIWEPSWAKVSVIGACVPSGASAEAGPWRKLRIDVVGTLSNVRDVVTASGADTVIVIPRSGLSAADLRRLVWMLDDVETELFLSQSIMDMGTSRQSTASVAGLSLIKVNRHKRDGLQAHIQAVADRVLAAVLIIFLSWPLLVIGILVRLTSSGPALFRQRRVGRYGKQFTMYKFRTMYADSASLEAKLTQLNYSGDGLLFKMRRDPPITSVGSFLRRSSLDELPQLINVLKGDMSLVGPRPPLPEEVEEYSPEVRRRLLVKPGLTGLWQISGRSDLGWEESVRLDLLYIDNWSISLNFRILMRTFSAVVRGTGAY